MSGWVKITINYAQMRVQIPKGKKQIFGKWGGAM